MDSFLTGSSRFDNVQSFIESIGSSEKPWSLLLKRQVTHFALGKGKIISIDNYGMTISVEYSLNTISYSKELFAKEFKDIDPPIFIEDILELTQPEEAKKRRLLLQELEECFKTNFLRIYDFYQNKCCSFLSFSQFELEKAKYVQLWVEQHLNCEVDLEQAAAIAAVENHVQVVARAGSGKTSTLVNRALFLQQHCGVSPNEMLLLAFNRKAVREIQERLTQKLNNLIPHVMTFHALGYALVQPEGKILFDEPDGEQSKSYALQSDVIASYVRNPKYHDAIRALMMARFRRDWERIESGGYDKSPKEMLRYRHSLPREAMDGTYVKSFGEKVIANFLFEHDIQYRYERAFKWWDSSNYRPDFTLEQHNIVIEYFGLQGDPDYDALSDGKRKYWQNKTEWRFLEFFADILRYEGEAAFCDHLKHTLESCGVKCNRLSEDEIWRRIKDRPHTIDRFTKAVVGFIQRCRKQSLNSEQLAEMIRCHPCADGIEQQFLDLVQVFYRGYLERLQTTGEEDFDGLMQKAAQVVSAGQTIFRRQSGTGDLRRLRYVLIDEYQDFSDLFHRLISAIQVQNPQAQFFCVGDDWQAINGFAGSDLSFYQKFTQYFQAASTLKITTNYRSTSTIVRVGNDLMQGLGTPARVYQQTSGKVEIVNLDSFRPTIKEKEEHRSDDFTPAVLRLLRKLIQDGKEVVLLSRKNSLPWPIYDGQKSYASSGKTLDRFLELIRSYLPETSRSAVTISTAHGYKGLEKKVVILLDAVPCCYPLLHPDWIFTRILGDSLEQIIAEERRLFYVALTRAVEQVFIITEGRNRSPFLDDLEQQRNLPRLNWSDYVSTESITVKVGNQDGRGSAPTYAIMPLLKAEAYCWKIHGWQAWCRTYPAQNFSIQQIFEKAQWTKVADGVEVRFHNELDETLAIYRINQGRQICIFDHWDAQE